MHPTVLLLLFFGGLSLFGAVWWELIEHRFSLEFDREWWGALAPWREGEALRFVRILTEAGGPLPVAAATVLGALALIVAKRVREGLYLFASMGGALLLFGAVKHLVLRPRPVWRVIEQGGYSFPSGHATMAAALAVAVYVLIAPRIPSAWGRGLVAATLALWPLVIGASRVDLGVHYASDVLAGWGLGASWAALCALAFFHRQRSGQIL
ncbi:phosphatase PAP2 family protein [Nitratifractor sp.]